MAFLIVFFTVALSLCVVGLVVISLWWSWLFLAAILGSVRSDWKLKKPEREPRSEGLLSSVTTSAPNPPPPRGPRQQGRGARHKSGPERKKKKTQSINTTIAIAMVAAMTFFNSFCSTIAPNSGVSAGRQRDHPQEGRHRLGACHIQAHH